MSSNKYVFTQTGAEIQGLLNEIPDHRAAIAALEGTEITWSELVAARDGGELVAGGRYRITDFVTTTAAADTESAGHAFDVIVLALDVDKVSEIAFAALHEGDEYFEDSLMSAWELRYCLDNDTNRFDWADATNGKGVIYWMKDEWGNECGYDFKNMKFKRWMLTDNANNDDVFSYTYAGIYGHVTPGLSINDEDEYEMEYTFATTAEGGGTDSSLTGLAYGNIVKGWNVTIFDGSNHNVIGEECSRISIIECYNVSIGNNSSDMVFGPSSKNITIGCESSGFTFRRANEEINVGHHCQTFNFGSRIQYVTIASYDLSVMLAQDCKGIDIRDNCDTIVFGTDCSNITVRTGVDHCELGTESCNGSVLSGVSNKIVQFQTTSTEGEEFAGQTTGGVLKIWNPADLVS